MSKLNIALKEARETHYWLRLLIASNLMRADSVDELQQEAEELKKILGAIIVSTKQNKGIAT